VARAPDSPADLLHWSATVRFVTSFLAIVPLAKVCPDDIRRPAVKGRRIDCGWSGLIIAALG